MCFRLRAFSSSMPNIWHLTHQTLKNHPPSSVLNVIIFGIDEQCNIIFEAALFTNCKTYLIFLFSGAHFLFFLLFLFLPHFFLSIQSRPSSFSVFFFFFFLSLQCLFSPFWIHGRHS